LLAASFEVVLPPLLPMGFFLGEDFGGFSFPFPSGRNLFAFFFSAEITDPPERVFSFLPNSLFVSCFFSGINALPVGGAEGVSPE